MNNNQTRNARPGAIDRRYAPRRRPLDKDARELWYHNILFLVLYPLAFIYLELVLHLALFGSVTGTTFVYIVLFSLAGGLLFALLSTLFSQKVNYFVTLGIIGFFSVYYNVQLIYCKFFKDFFYWNLLKVSGNISNFWRETLGCIVSNLHYVILLFLPLVLFALLGRRVTPPRTMGWILRGIGLLLAVFFLLSGINFVNFHNGDFEDKYYYRSGFTMTEAAGRFGVLTALRLDTQYLLFGTPDDEIPVNPGVVTTTPSWIDIFGTTADGRTDPVTSPATEPSTGGETGGETGGDTTPVTPEVTTEPPKPLDTSPNVLDIDFDSLIANTSNTAMKNAHIYFQSAAPTLKNEYTGLFEGKNLIFITVEGWNKQCIDKNLTPTLYRMMTEGFVFDNYYCSCWGGSTATGEYANMTGNFYTSASCLKDSADNLMKFTLGNMLSKKGYSTLGFHNWLYDYYGRERSHPNMGYTWFGTRSDSSANYYTGIPGWDVTFTRHWPPADRELATNTLSFITADKPFHLYYMTVSGHAYQTFSGNSNAKANKLAVMTAGLPYNNENVLSYIASEYEVELMVKALCDDLEAKGILDDTVFVMAPDHYPYELNQDEATAQAALSEMYGLPVEGIVGNLDLYRSALIIWSASMEKPVEVSKVCSAIDILPTVLNLFGLDYDSRILTGKDILSTSEGLLPINCNGNGGSWHWVTDFGRYNTKTKTFTPAPGVTVDASQLPTYISHYNTVIANMNKYSKFILEKDYYRVLFPNG